MNQEFPDVQGGLRKGRGIRDPIANTHWNIKKQENSRKKKKNIYFFCID